MGPAVNSDPGWTASTAAQPGTYLLLEKGSRVVFASFMKIESHPGADILLVKHQDILAVVTDDGAPVP